MFYQTPVFVPYDDFCLLYHESGKRDALRARKYIRVCIVLAALAICCAVAVFAKAFQGMPYDNRLVMGASALVGVALSAQMAIWNEGTASFRVQVGHYDFKIKRAQKLLKNYAYFNDSHKQWKGSHQSTKDVMHWCTVNGIEANIATFENPMFGEFGLYISFDDDDGNDPEQAVEALIFFRLKFL